MTTLIIIAAIILLFVLMGLLTKKELNVVKTIAIDKPSAELFDYLKFVKNHDHFSEWAKPIPQDKKHYRGTDGQAGFVFAWDSGDNKNVGSGEQEIMKMEDGKSIEHQLRFILPRPGVAKVIFRLRPLSGSKTEVEWGFYSEMKFPATIMKPIIRSFLSKNTEKGLQNLKAVMEK